MAEGNIHSNGPIRSGRKGENSDAYRENYERIFGKPGEKNREAEQPKKRSFTMRVNGQVV